MSKEERRKILVQLDTDPHPSVFDRVVAVDAGADEIFSYGSVRPEDVKGMVHGAIFTRGAKHLHRTAIFVGGSDVAAGETLLAEAKKHLLADYGLSVSLMLDANGANTTAVAAVRCAGRHCDLRSTRALVLGATGPVGQRVALLLASQGADVGVGSRKRERADAILPSIRAKVSDANLTPFATATEEELVEALQGRSLVIAAGAEGVVLLPQAIRTRCEHLAIAIDLNAVPPLGIEGVEMTDKAEHRDGVCAYGAIGVGELKMKIHKAALAQLFEKNNRTLDALEIFALADSLD